MNKIKITIIMTMKIMYVIYSPQRRYQIYLHPRQYRNPHSCSMLTIWKDNKLILV